MCVNRAPGIGKGYSEVLIHYGINQGLSVSTCLKGSGLNEDFLESQVDVTSEQEIILIKNLLKEIHNPFETGFAIGKNFHFGALGMVGMALITSKNGKDMANIVSRYLNNACHPTEPKLKLLPQKFKLSWVCRAGFDDDIAQFLIARDVGIFGAIQEHYLQGGYKEVMELGFEFPYLKGMENMADYFSCHVRYNQPDNYLIASQSQLKKTLPLYNPIASTTTEKYYQEHLKNHISPIGIIDKIQDIISPRIKNTPDMQEVAKALNMSTRSLARQLEKNKTNWRNLVSKIRIEKAEGILLETILPLCDIAEIVGFANPSSFSHAFTKQKGISPSEYRKRVSEFA